MQIQILDDSGEPWTTFRRRHPGGPSSLWVDEDEDLLGSSYQDALDDLAAVVEADPYWVISVNRGRLSK